LDNCPFFFSSGAGVVFKVTYLWIYAVGVGVEKYHFCSAWKWMVIRYRT